MLTVSLSTLVSVVLVFLFIIFFLLILRAKPTKNQVKEMKETGWEIVEQIEQQVQQMEGLKQEVEEKLERMNVMEQRFLQMSEPIVSTKQTQPEKIMPTLHASSVVSQQKLRIITLYRAGCASEEIAAQLHLQKGVVDVVLNIEKMKKQA